MKLIHTALMATPWLLWLLCFKSPSQLTPVAEEPDYSAVVTVDRPVAFYQFEQHDQSELCLARNSAAPKNSDLDGVCSPGVVTVKGLSGPGGEMARFNGSGLIELPPANAFHLDELTVEFWFRSEQEFDQKFWPGSATLVSKATAGPGSGDWVILGGSLTTGSNEGRILVGVGPKGDQDRVLASGTGLNDGQFHHVVWTRSGTGLNTLYVDGQACATEQDSKGSIINARPIQIGGEKFEPGGSQFRGDLGELAIYPHALTADRVQSHFLIGSVDPRLPPASNVQVDFSRDIQPIFQEHCSRCHGNGKEKGGLSLSTRSRALDGGDTGPAMIPGLSSRSQLVSLVAAIDEDRIMPPDGEKLEDSQIGLIRAWIDQGANWPAEAEEIDPKTVRALEHWSFKPIRRPEIPQTLQPDWNQTPVDPFIFAKLAANDLKPSPPANKLALLRRLTFDLTGLPPQPEEILEFANDNRPDAFSRVVDRLLASTALGERLGRYWLDVVRYADSGGYETDIYYEQAWRYRDYVIRSFNEGKPFDRFLMEQVAGDELWPAEANAMQDAVAVWTLGEWQNALDAFPEELEYTRRTDQVITYSESMLGLTAGCANCHNHKFDPISQRDYFGLEAIFAASETWDRSTNQKAWLKGQRTAYRIFRHSEIPTPIHLLTRGEIKKPRGLVSPALPAFLAGEEAGFSAPMANSQRRAMLANWTVSPRNPMTARVIANRLWQWHIGQAIASTPNDLGTQGQPPTHPELLDWLASELMESGWNLKHLQRLMVLSATYQQSAERTPEAISRDPQNQFLSSFPRKRLQAEAVWDQLHAAAGVLDRKSSGPPFVPKLTPEELQGMYDLEDRKDKKWPVTPEQNRRAIYILNRRSFRFPFLEAFDPANNSTSCPVRQSTTVPAQALTLLNNDKVVELARAMAERLSRATRTHRERIQLAWLLAYSRVPSEQEIQLTQDFLNQALAAQTNKGTPDPHLAALTELCLALMNSAEFLQTN